MTNVAWLYTDANIKVQRQVPHYTFSHVYVAIYYFARLLAVNIRSRLNVYWKFKDVFATFYHVLRILSSFIRKRFIVTIGNTVSRSKSSENKLLFFANFLMWSSDMSSKEIGKNLTIINLYHSKHVISCLRCSIWENDTFRILFVSTIA